MCIRDSPWVNGAGAVIYNGPRNPAVWPVLIERYAATHFAAVPGVYRQVLARTSLDPGDLPTLRHGLVAGEALTPALWTAWREATGRELYEALGMSELSTPTGREEALRAVPRPDGTVMVIHERAENADLRERGGWIFDARLVAPKGTDRIGVVVEELGTGAWGGVVARWGS